jgi:GNAT superfamily N-acetyltransferase
MDDLYVRPEYRGKGIGTHLVQKIISLAKASACHKLRWQVSNWNTTAIDFYKSLGASIDPVEQNCDLALD